MADKVENTKPEPKKKKEFEYKLHSHTDKLSMLLEMMFELEQALFAHNINMLDKEHSQYQEWYERKVDIENEIGRLRFIYEKLGGAWENLQDDMWEEMVDEYGEPLDDTN
tara:strand:- start:19 stop:348 length:330 start_codon:yes stop_codon:yes gene_type:complete